METDSETSIMETDSDCPSSSSDDEVTPPRAPFIPRTALAPRFSLLSRAPLMVIGPIWGRHWNPVQTLNRHERTQKQEFEKRVFAMDNFAVLITMPDNFNRDEYEVFSDCESETDKKKKGKDK
ncbi:hypothetical protein FN846DRAFT_889986 [Sphaerosporella brunnea]|uniref:Uncharacterized protein n=1 Tax=Sphaerosporella brunnea TaxID=1250544 RepID=A0A5J5EZ23_9PEZI|nr:hypothetical protein FN846DRAFT_889986 [Sphaerosporella brunnea]